MTVDNFPNDIASEATSQEASAAIHAGSLEAAEQRHQEQLSPSDSFESSAVSDTEDVLHFNVGNKTKRMSDRSQFQADMKRFLEASKERLQLFSSNSDEYEAFGSYVSSQLRSKERREAHMCMKKINEILFGNI